MIRIDIEHRPEQTIIPAFSIGLDIDYELLGGNVSEYPTMNTEFLIRITPEKAYLLIGITKI